MDTIYVEKRFYRLKMKAFQIIEEATAELARRKSGGGPPDSVAARCTHKAGGRGCKTVRVRGLRL